MSVPETLEFKPTPPRFINNNCDMASCRINSWTYWVLLLLVVWGAAAVTAAITFGDSHIYPINHRYAERRPGMETETINLRVHAEPHYSSPPDSAPVTARPSAAKVFEVKPVPSSWRVRQEPVKSRGLGLGPWKPPAGVNTSAVGPGPTWYGRTSSSRVAVVRISRDTDSAAAAFAENIGSYPNYDAIMVTDEEPEGGEPWAMKKVGNVTYVRVNAKVAEAAGFSHSHVHAIFKARRRTLSQDKAMFYLARLAPDPNWSYVWLVEDDVFVPGPSSFAYFDSQYPEVDVLCKYVVPEQTVDTPAPGWNNWGYVQDVPPPRWRTLASAIRVSNRMLDRWLHFAREHGKLAFHESLPLTLAFHANYSVETPKELSTMSCCNRTPPSVKKVVDHAKALPHAFWHRVKNVTHHEVYRDALSVSL